MAWSITVKPYRDAGAPDSDGRDAQSDWLAASPEEPVLASYLGERSSATRSADNDKWLNDLLGPQPAPGTPAGQPPESARPAASKPVAAASAATSDPSASLLDRAMSTANSVGSDIAKGAVEAPRQILGGMRDAAQAAINLGDWLADKAESILPLGGVQVFDDKGGFSPEYIPAGDKRLAPDKTGGSLPTVREAKTTTGSVVRSVSQFLTGFMAAGPAASAVIASAIPRAMLQGSLADFTAFDAHEKRLSDLIQQVPALQNPVSEYLASNKEDGEIEGRLKNAIEGLGLGAMTEGVFRAVRYIRDGRRASAAADPEKAAAREMAKPPELNGLPLLGDDAAPLIEKKMRAAAKTTDTGVPDDVAAAALTPKGLSPLREGNNPVYINFAKIETPDDIKKVLADTANAFADDIDKARRGVRSNRQTLNAAGGVDAWKVLTERRVGEPLNAEQAVAARQLWEASAAKLFEVAEVAARTKSPEDLYQFRKMLAIHQAVQVEVTAARTETARALQSWAIPVGASGAERMRSVENLLTSHGGGEAAGILAERVAALARLPNGAEALAGMAEKGAMARSTDAIKELWINMILSNPKTHLVNAMGNAGSLGLDLIERAAATRWSQMIGSGDMLPGEAAAKAFATSQGLKEGFRLLLQSIRAGESQFGAATSKTADMGFERAITAGNLGISGDNWFAKSVDGLGAILNAPTRALTGADDFFKGVAYRMEVNAQAFRQASQEVTDFGLPRDMLNARIAELASNPPDNIRMAATDAALYQTFTNTPGKLVQSINAFDRKLSASDYAGAQMGSLFFRYMIPFRTTLANISSYGIERTPLAPLLGRYQEAIAQGGATADVARTRMALGTFGILALMDMAMDGNITGSGPSRKKAEERGTRQTMERSGWQPYSIKVGDRYFSYKRTDPVGLSIGIAADLAQVINNSHLDEDKGETIMQMVAMSAATFGNMMLDKHYVQGLSEFFDVMQSPDKAPRYLDRMIVSPLVPSATREIRRQVDPYMRYVAGAMDELRNGTPGLSDTLPMARDFWGRPRTYQSGMGQVYDAISPIASRKDNPEPIDREAIANDFNLIMPNWSLSYGTGVNVSLKNRPEVYSRYLELRGQTKPSDMGGDLSGALIKRYGDKTLLEVVNDIVEGRHRLSPEYARSGGGNNGGKDGLISDIVRKYGEAARDALLYEFDDVDRVAEKKREERSRRK